MALHVELILQRDGYSMQWSYGTGSLLQVIVQCYGLVYSLREEDFGEAVGFGMGRYCSVISN